MARRGIAILAHGNPARLGNFLGDFVTGQNTTVTRLGSLRELDFDHFYLGQARIFDECFFRKSPKIVATAKISRADIPYQGAAWALVVGADTALSGIVREITLPRTFVKRQDGVSR